MLLSHYDLVLVKCHLLLLLFFCTFAGFLAAQHWYGVFKLFHKLLLPLVLLLLEFDLLALLGGVTVRMKVVDDVQRLVFVGLLAEVRRVHSIVRVPLLGSEIHLVDGLRLV